MTDKKASVHSHSHWRNVKRKAWQRELVAKVVELVACNDHDSLALIARTSGIPPQLRRDVWPVLLKYHPMVISPNILSNTLAWDSQKNKWHYSQEARSGEEIETSITQDLRKYFRRRSAAGTNGPSGLESSRESAEENHIVTLLKGCILEFLAKWSRLFRYESGLAWIALALAEWIPIDDSNRVLQGKRHESPVDLLSEYPLPDELIQRLPSKPEFNFSQIYERIVLVILHCPDIAMAQKLAQTESPNFSASQYYPVLSGGDLSFQSQIFFKVFSVILPELYQPIAEEETLRPSKKANWIYWWFKCSGTRVFHKQDRARLWDSLLGWRPNPACINFYLNYNNKVFEHLYSTTASTSIDQIFFDKICKYGHDTFWFPDLDTMRLGSSRLKCDFQVFSELLRRNKYDDSDLESLPSANLGFQDDTQSQDVDIPFSLVDPHIQLVFVYIAILQQHEFKLLEFEEAEISEFLNNVPPLSRSDDHNYRHLYAPEEDQRSVSSSEAEQEEISKKPTSSSSNSHMLIEVGDDDKTSYSFDDIFNCAGDIWRKWIWRELQEYSCD
ncbi:LAMI_0F05006g1_1 [Lachancea mirantina]|uniref:LAMI_0F05006g1_1 n=1 Tax=Lachancea mirantina TaxID=1230905 RepID=A0A1G4JXZ1_9SACH|nr:LAMI_0F05006g1_1 [Lachancea mirantina]